jgi:alpha-methylacyl-CoA racemase
MKQRFEAIFKSKTRADWTRIFDGTDACAFPVLTPIEASEHEHNRARESFRETGGVLHPAPAPRFSRSSTEKPSDPPRTGEHSQAVLREFGFGPEEIAMLRLARAIA